MINRRRIAKESSAFLDRGNPQWKGIYAFPPKWMESEKDPFDFRKELLEIRMMINSLKTQKDPIRWGYTSKFESKNCNHSCSPSDFYMGGKCDKMGCMTEFKIQEEEKKNTCPSCKKNKAQKQHPCPFEEDVNNNSEIACFCCDECMERCLKDI